ncbi:MAG: glycosyltransferase family A protein [Cyanobacteria bacterium J06555_13]
MPLVSSPLVSVIVPAYNSESTVLATIESVLQQTYQNLELIVIDDGATDGTVAALQNVADPRLKIFSFANGGLPTARNRGIERASGQFLSFIDADDLWTTDKLAKQMRALEDHPKAGGVYSWTLIMDEKGEKFYPGNCEAFEGDVYPHLLLSNFIGSGSNMLLRREAVESVGNFDVTLDSHEDWDYYLRLSQQWEFAVVPEPQILYRKTANSLSSRLPVLEKYILILHERVFSNISPELAHLEAYSMARKYEFLTQIALTNVSGWSNCTYALRTLSRAIAHYPKILFTRRTSILIGKLVISLALTPRFANRALVFLLALRSKRYMSKRYINKPASHISKPKTGQNIQVATP